MKKRLLFLWFVLGIMVFYEYGRSLYMPVMQKVKGRETVASLIAKIQSGVGNRLEYDLGIAGYKMDYPSTLILAAFKEERVLQVYAKSHTGIRFLKEYPFTAYSGELGPKLKEGDRQIPEGVYEVEYLNPNSAYYLSIKVNYPNEFDQAKSTLANQNEMGGDIFIHGKAATIGCIPIGDEAIEEVFFLTSKAINNPVKVIISPRDFRIKKDYPLIEGIDWEMELYDQINKELKQLPYKG